MKRWNNKIFSLALNIMLMAAAFLAEAEQAGKIVRIGLHSM